MAGIDDVDNGVLSACTPEGARALGEMVELQRVLDDAAYSAEMDKFRKLRLANESQPAIPTPE